MNIRYLQDQLSRIEEIHVIGKNAELNGVICHVMGVVRYGKQMRLLVLEYDQAFQEQIEETEKRYMADEVDGGRKIDMNNPLRGVHKVYIGDKEFEVNKSKTRRINSRDFESVLLFSEFLRHGWEPKGVDSQNLDMLFLTSMNLGDDITAIPAFEEDPTLHFTMRPKPVKDRIEEPISLVIGNHYPDILRFRDADSNDEFWAQINRVYLTDIWAKVNRGVT